MDEIEFAEKVAAWCEEKMRARCREDLFSALKDLRKNFEDYKQRVKEEGV